MFASIVDQYATGNDSMVDDHDNNDDNNDNDNIKVELVTIPKALKALEIVNMWELQKEHREQAIISVLDRTEH